MVDTLCHMTCPSMFEPNKNPPYSPSAIPSALWRRRRCHPRESSFAPQNTHPTALSLCAPCRGPLRCEELIHLIYCVSPEPAPVSGVERLSKCWMNELPNKITQKRKTKLIIINSLYQKNGSQGQIFLLHFPFLYIPLKKKSLYYIKLNHNF